MKKIKWAIYKGEIGLYAWEYVDTLKRAREYIGGHMIQKNDLPMIFNSVGGRTFFDKKDPNFVEIRTTPEDQEPLTAEERYPKNQDNFKLGWIDPDGNTYSICYGSHREAAAILVETDYIKKAMTAKDHFLTYCSPDDYLGDNGWISVCEIYPDTFVFSKTNKITKAQFETLKKLGHENDIYVQMYLKNMEE